MEDKPNRAGRGALAALDPRRSLRSRIALVFGVLGALITLGGAFAIEAYLLARESESDDQRLAHAARRFAEILSHDLRFRLRELAGLSRFPLLRSELLPDAERRSGLQALSEAAEDYSWIGFADTSGVVRVAAGGVLEGRSMAGAGWFQQGLAAPYLGNAPAAGPGADTEPARLLEIAVPVRHRGEVIGVLAAYLSPRWVEKRRAEFLRGALRLLGADVALIDGTGRVVIGAPGPVAADRAVPSWVSQPDGGTYEFEAAPGERWNASAAGLDGAAGSLGLRVLAQRPLARSDSGLRGVILVVGLMGALALMFAAWLAAERVTGPLRELAATATRISAGETAAPFPAVRGRDEVGALGAALSSLVDRLLENQRQLEAKVAERTRDLMAANRDLEAFSYSVSHDLRAPLRSIHGFASLLREETAGKLPGSASEQLARVLGNAEVMAERFEGLLSLARLSREPIALRDVPVGEIAADIAEGLARAAPEREIEFEIDRQLRARGDPRLLRLALENLLGNAWKYSSRAPAAHIEFGRTPQGEYFVRDNGAGFDPAWAGALFAPFRRLHDAAEFPGTGVGLASVKRIVERHGGSIRAEASPGRGAAFFFTLGKEGDSSA